MHFTSDSMSLQMSRKHARDLLGVEKHLTFVIHKAKDKTYSQFLELLHLVLIKFTS